MKNKKTYILSAVVCLLPLIAGAILYKKLPNEIVTNWSTNGTPNDTTGKFTAVFIYPGVLFLLDLLFPALVRLDPKNRDLSGKVYGLIRWIIPAVTLICSGMTLAWASGARFSVALVCSLFFGLMIVIVGNYLPKMKQSYTIGIKLPWTLESEENWNRTHRFAGSVWVLCGIAVILSSFFRFALKPAFLIAVLVLMLIAPAVYSYALYRRSPAEKAR